MLHIPFSHTCTERIYHSTPYLQLTLRCHTRVLRPPNSPLHPEAQIIALLLNITCLNKSAMLIKGNIRCQFSNFFGTRIYRKLLIKLELLYSAVKWLEQIRNESKYVICLQSSFSVVFPSSLMLTWILVFHIC